MANTHLLPDTGAELQATCGDLLAPAILASSLAVPGGGMTLAPFVTYGYVRNGAPTRLVYVNQVAAAVTLAGSDGPYWLALMHDTHSAVASWTRQPGTHYAWRSSATRPADPSGGLVMAGVTVAGGAITAVDTTLNYPYTKVAFGGISGQLAFDGNFTWNGSTLTVRNIVNSRQFIVDDHPGDNLVAFHSSVQAAGGTNRWFMYSGGTAPSLLSGTLQVNNSLGLGGGPQPGYSLYTYFPSSLTANVGIGLGLTPMTATLDVNGTVRSRGGLTCDTWAGLGGAADSRFSLRSYGTSHFDGFVGIAVVPTYRLHVNGDTMLGGMLGLGIAPGAPWSLAAAGSILTYANLQANGTLWVGGGATLNSTLYVTAGASLQAGLTVTGHTHHNGGIYSTGNVDTGGSFNGAYMTTNGIQVNGNANVTGTLGTQYMQTGLEVGIMRNAQAGWALSVAGAIQTSSSIANKLGAGPWGESSSRHLKRNITAIPDALSLLLAQRGRRYEWDEPQRAAALPGLQHGFVYDEVTVPQWKDIGPHGEEMLTIRGFEALTVEALRAIVVRLEALEGA